MVSISASVTVFTTGGMKVGAAAAGDAVMVSGGPIPELQTDSTDITFEDFGVLGFRVDYGDEFCRRCRD